MNITSAVHAVLIAALLGASASTLAQTRPVTNFYYDANGNLTSSTDALGRTTQQGYDALNRLRVITQPIPATGQTAPVIQIDVNARDDVTRVVDPRNLATTYTVNGLSDVTNQLSPDTGTTVRTYDAAGNLKTSRDARNKTTTYTYDNINRLTQVKYGDNSITTFAYDQGANGVGRLTGMTDPGPITTSWSYDIQGRVLSKTQVIGSGTSARTHTLTYSYNATTGQLASMTYPSGRLVTFGYHPSTKDIDSVRLDGVPMASGVVYHPTGGIKQMTLGNSQTWSSTLDQDGRITSYKLGGVSYTVTWDAANRITAITHPSDGSLTRAFTYDNLDRITGFGSPPRDQGFAYDKSGNLLSRLDRIGSNEAVTDLYNIDPASNRMTSISSRGIGYSFDAAGNRTNDGRIAYTYNARGRMSKAVVTNAALTDTFNYLINGIGQRVRKTGPSAIVPQGTRIFVYDDGGQLLGEYDNLGRARTEHLWLEGRPIAVLTYTYSGSSTTPLTTTTSYVEADHLGTPRLITNASRQARWSWHSAPYGDTLPNENPASLGVYTYNLRFPGQYFDSETGNHYNHHRDYESTSGRYIQSDPIGLQGGINTYAYVGGRPLSASDPLGLQAQILSPLCGPAWWLCLGAATMATAVGVQGTMNALSGQRSSSAETCQPDDPCQQFQRELQAYLDGMDGKYADLLADKDHLYTRAFSNQVSGLYGTWTGHVDRYNGMVIGLLRLIERGKAMGCPIPARAYVNLTRSTPERPTGR